MRSECGVNNIHLCVISTLQADAGDIIMWRLFSWHILDPVGPNGHYLSITAYLSILADLIYAFVTTIYKSPDFCFQQDNTDMTVRMGSTITRPQSKGAPFGCGGMGDMLHGCEADK